MGLCWTPPSCGHNYRLQGATSQPFRKRDTLHKGKDKSPSDWPPQNPGPSKGFFKGSPKSIPKGLPKGPDKGKSFGKGIAAPPVFAPAANASPPKPSLRPTYLPSSIGLLSAWAYCPAPSMAPLPITVHLTWFISVFVYVPWDFTMFPTCPLFLAPLSFSWWGQPGHTVRLVPSLPLLSALYTFSSLFSFLSLGLSLSLRVGLVSFVGFSLSFIRIFSALWPAWAYCPARHSSLSLLRTIFSSSAISPFSPPSSPSPLPSPLSRCLPKAASPNVATPYDPKRSLAAMS